MNEGFDQTEQEMDLALSCSVKSPHATWSVFRVGDMSILFSYGRPVGFSTETRAFVVDGVKRATQKHLNSWHDFRQQETVQPDEFISRLVDALEKAIDHIRSTVPFPFKEK
jgi:hypothetical protein